MKKHPSPSLPGLNRYTAALAGRALELKGFHTAATPVKLPPKMGIPNRIYTHSATVFEPVCCKTDLGRIRLKPDEAPETFRQLKVAVKTSMKGSGKKITTILKAAPILSLVPHDGIKNI